jgi:hypothetical protein
MLGEPIDYWDEVCWRGVQALGFSLKRQGHDRVWMAAELADDDAGPVRRAAYAAIELHKLVGLERGTALRHAYDLLLSLLEAGPARDEVHAYQAELARRLRSDISSDPARALEALAHPHEF